MVYPSAFVQDRYNSGYFKYFYRGMELSVGGCHVFNAENAEIITPRTH